MKCYHVEFDVKGDNLDKDWRLNLGNLIKLIKETFDYRNAVYLDEGMDTVVSNIKISKSIRR